MSADSDEGPRRSLLRRDQRTAAFRQLWAKCIPYLKRRLDVASELAVELTPHLNDYLASVDQVTVDGQRQACEEIRELCQANDLAIRGPKSGLPTLVYVIPQYDRDSRPRIGYKNNGRTIEYSKMLNRIELMPSEHVFQAIDESVQPRGPSKYR